jgi:hypothetical protein
VPEAEEAEIYAIFSKYGIDKAHVSDIVTALKKDEEMWVKVS